MMQRILSLLFVLALVLSGCSSVPSVRKVVSLNIEGDPGVLDPRFSRDTSSSSVVRMLFEGLVRMGPSEKTENALAERIEISADGVLYTFHLRESIWSNNDPVTAHDFVYAWQKILSPDFPSASADQLFVIKNGRAAKSGKVFLSQVGLRAVDDHTLEVELELPTPYFLDLLVFPSFFPVNERVERENPDWALSADTYVGNGPFLLKEWKRNDHLSLDRNPTYWEKEKTKLEQLQIMIVKAETAYRMFEKKELDWTGSPLSQLPVDALEHLKGKGVLRANPMLGTWFIRLDTDRGPFQNGHIRQAFSLAVDRDSLVQHVLQGGQLPAGGLVPPSLKGSKPFLAAFSVEEAKGCLQLGLQELSLPQLPEVTLTYLSLERNHLVMQALQQQWASALGVRVKLEAVEGKVYFDRVAKREFQMASSSWLADYSDPINFLELFQNKTSRGNQTGWEHPQYAELLQASSRASGVPRLALLDQAEEILIKEMPIIPLFYGASLSLCQERLKGVVVSSLGTIDFRWAEVQE